MEENQAAMFLQSLRGVEALIMLAYILIKRGLTVEEVCLFTGRDDAAVRRSLNRLKSKGYLYKQVGEHGRQTWVPKNDTFFFLVDDQLSHFKQADDVVVNVESEERRNLPSTLTTNKRQLSHFKQAGDKILSVHVVVKDPDDIEKCLAALHEAGVHGKKAEKLAYDHHVTVDDIQAHWKQVQNELWDNPQGMLIYRLEYHVPAPELNESGHSVGCKCVECSSRDVMMKYGGGEFSAFVNVGDDDDEESEEA